jgi:hypothetical protein
MKSSTPLFAGLFVLFFGMLGCEKEVINPSQIERILGDYDITCCSWDTGKRLLISKKNDSVVEIRVLSDYPNNLRSLKYVFKELTIKKPMNPSDSTFYSMVGTYRVNTEVGLFRTRKARTVLSLFGAVDSITQQIQGIQAIKLLN